MYADTGRPNLRIPEFGEIRRFLGVVRSGMGEQLMSFGGRLVIPILSLYAAGRVGAEFSQADRNRR